MQNLIRLLLAEICWAAELDKYLYFSAYNSHCSDQSGVSVFSLTDVWNFSFPRPIVTNASLVPADVIFNISHSFILTEEEGLSAVV